MSKVVATVSVKGALKVIQPTHLDNVSYQVVNTIDILIVTIDHEGDRPDMEAKVNEFFSSHIVGTEAGALIANLFVDGKYEVIVSWN